MFQCHHVGRCWLDVADVLPLKFTNKSMRSLVYYGCFVFFSGQKISPSLPGRKKSVVAGCVFLFGILPKKN